VRSPLPILCFALIACAPALRAQATAKPGHPYFEFQVESQVRTVSGSPMPQYPDTLRAAKIQGEVLAQFVVDEGGRYVPGTFKALKSSHTLFTAAVREALPKMKFVPAEIGGHRVRQLVQQPFVFALDK
jgi:TonB family C-terminal domain